MSITRKTYRIELMIHEVLVDENNEAYLESVTAGEVDIQFSLLEFLRTDPIMIPSMIRHYINSGAYKISDAITPQVSENVIKGFKL